MRLALLLLLTVLMSLLDQHRSFSFFPFHMASAQSVTTNAAAFHCALELSKAIWDIEEQTCSWCEKRRGNQQGEPCKLCNSAWYCSKDCRTKDAKRHKAACKQAVKERKNANCKKA